MRILLENTLEKTTHPSKLLEIQQNLPDDQAKAKLRVGLNVIVLHRVIYYE